MRKTLLLPIMAAALALTSCSKQFYQVYTTEAPELVEKDNALIYENKDCIVKYNLWAEDGTLGYTVYNKTEQNLFIILPQSFFIKNGTAYDYFENKEYRRTVSLSTSSEGPASSFIYGTMLHLGSYYDGAILAIQNKKNTRGTVYTLVEKERETVCIPPHSQKSFSKFSLWDRLIRNCDKEQAYPKRKSTPIKYTELSSPLVFSNRMAYAFNEKGDGLNYIVNKFWVSELINYSKKEACETVIYKECEKDMATKRSIFKIYSPRKFYNSYVEVNKNLNSF